jgi:hypothetical protein
MLHSQVFEGMCIFADQEKERGRKEGEEREGKEGGDKKWPLRPVFLIWPVPPTPPPLP